MLGNGCSLQRSLATAPRGGCGDLTLGGSRRTGNTVGLLANDWLKMMTSKILFAVLACTLIVGCDRVDPNSPLGQRQAIFKDMLKTSEDLGGMLRGRLMFNAERFTQGATHLDEISRQPWQHFPQVRENLDGSQARDEVWQRQERFQQLARELEASTAELRAAAQVQPLRKPALVDPVAKVEAACRACHDEFRVY